MDDAAADYFSAADHDFCGGFGYGPALRHLLVAEPSSSDKKLLGILSKYDIARAFPDHYNPFSLDVTEETVSKPISTIMVRNVVTVEPYCAIEEAAHILRTRRINALPVVRSGYLVGIITESDIFDAFVGVIGPNSHGTKVILESNNVKNALVVMAQLADRHNLQILNALSFHGEKSNNKATSVFHFTGKPAASFPQDLGKAGFRVLKIA